MQRFNSVWLYTDDISEFSNRRDAFLYVIERLLTQRKAKLANWPECIRAYAVPKDKQLKPYTPEDYLCLNSISDIIQTFKTAFPKNEEEMEDGLWFYGADCPYTIGWVQEDTGILLWD